MRLIYTPNPDYIHKVIVTAYEVGLLDRIAFERQVPFNEDTRIWDFNPLAKVPAMRLDDGSPLYGGLLICEYLDAQSANDVHVYPQDDSIWQVKRQAIMADGLFDATTNLRVESWRDPADWHRDYMARERRKMIGVLDRMEAEVAGFDGRPFDIAMICFAGSLSYLELRNPIREVALEDGDAGFDWRECRPKLAAWFDAIQDRPSIKHREPRLD